MFSTCDGTRERRGCEACSSRDCDPAPTILLVYCLHRRETVRTRWLLIRNEKNKKININTSMLGRAKRRKSPRHYLVLEPHRRIYPWWCDTHQILSCWDRIESSLWRDRPPSWSAMIIVRPWRCLNGICKWKQNRNKKLKFSLSGDFLFFW